MAHNGEIQHLSYHQKRLEKAFRDLFPEAIPFDLSHHLNPPQNGTKRVRVLYDAKSINVEYLDYQTKIPDSFQLVKTDISYSYKFADRSSIESAQKQFPGKEIVLVKNGLITDTAIANIACYIDQGWVTPRLPLLEGTTRARLLDEEKLTLADITVEMFLKADRIAVMNALTGFCEIKHATISKLSL